MPLPVSLVITGDASNAESALKGLDKSLEEAAAEAARLAKAMDAADKSIDRLAAAQTRAKTETAAARAELKAGAITQQEYNVRLLETKTILSLVEGSHRSAVNALKQAQGALAGAKVSSGQAAAGYQNFGRQVQDVAVQLQGGANLGTIISQQGGQIADAVAQMGGRFSGLASFLAGPWGAALIVGTGLLVNLGIEMYNAGEATEATDKKSLSLTDALSKVHYGTEEARKALVEYNAEQARARQNTDSMIKLNLAQAEAQLKVALATRLKTKALLEAIPFEENPNDPLAQQNIGARDFYAKKLADNDAGFKSAMQNIRNLRIQDAVRDAGAAADPIKAINNRYDDMAEAAKRAAEGNNALSRSLKGTLTDIERRRAADLKSERKSSSSPQTRTPRNQASQRAEYGEDVAKRLANITDQFSDIPQVTARASKAMRELDDISSDLARRPLTPNIKDLIEQVGRAKVVINDSLNKPFNDFIEKARESAEIDKLLLAGREDEARALSIVLDKQRQQGPLQKEQLDAVLATVRGERERAAVLRDQGQLIDANINAVRDFRASLVGTVADALRGRLSAERILASIGNSYVNIISQKLVEGMFGDTLRQLEAQASGADKVDAAGNRIATSLDKGGKAVEDFAAVVARASASIGGGSGEGTVGSSTANGAVNSADRAFFADLFGSIVPGKGPNGVPEATGDEIVVTANKRRSVDLSGTGNLLLDIVDKTLGRFAGGLPGLIIAGLRGPLNKLEQSLPQALQGAFTGGAASRIILGDRGTGGTIGGAIGGALGQKFGEQVLGKGLTAVGGKLLGSLAGPLGSVLGGVLGGAIGGLFKKTTSGGASIGLNSQGEAGVTGTAGNSADLKKTASGYAGTVTSALDQIAQALGADLGQFNVAIGKRSSGYIKVSASGNAAATTAKKPTSDIIYDGKDEGEAIMAALANAISDGAIAGVSAAVQRALKSSSDVDKAVKEALKVQQVELAIGGIGADMNKAFRDFERQAAERMRIATQYGFDVVKLEEVNAKDRLKLSEKLFREQAGSLQDLLDEMSFGSLFEGSAVDQRKALTAQIDAARAKANAGEEGAAEQLAQLLRQLNSVSRDAFGTTGGFAADQTLIRDAAREAVAATNARIEASQKASDPALQTTNATLDEMAGQNAQALAQLAAQSKYLKQMAEQWNFNGFGSIAAVAGYR